MFDISAIEQFDFNVEAGAVARRDHLITECRIELVQRFEPSHPAKRAGVVGHLACIQQRYTPERGGRDANQVSVIRHVADDLRACGVELIAPLAFDRAGESHEAQLA